jgi:hypothetical protein
LLLPTAVSWLPYSTEKVGGLQRLSAITPRRAQPGLLLLLLLLQMREQTCQAL